jgi:hypothetical protein
MHCTVPEMVQNTYVIFYKSLQQFYYTALNDSNNIKMELFEVFFSFGNTKVTLTKGSTVEASPLAKTALLKVLSQNVQHHDAKSTCLLNILPFSMGMLP